MKRFILIVIGTMFITTPAFAKVTEEQVLEAQKAWAEGIENISQVFIDEGDYKQAATDHINTLYAYQFSDVLFKPTLAADDQFRENFDQALSYFVGGSIKEDGGFAIKPWTNVRFGEQEIITYDHTAIAMGNYFFTAKGSEEEVKVEYTFHYVKDDEGNLRINVHHSSLPFTPAE